MGVMPMGAGGLGVVRGGLPGTSHDQSAEQLLCNSPPYVSTLIAKATAAVGNDLVMEAGDQVPRLVFGGVPSFEESKEATGELKMYMDAMYLSSPKSFESETSLIPGISLPWNSEIVDANTSIPGPKHVHQAVHLLRYNPKIQDVISSIACDPNVFQEVLKNPEVRKLINAVKFHEGSDTSEKEANVTQGGESGEGVMEKLKNVKYFMSKMVSSIPNHLPGLFGSSATESASGTGPDHEENATMKDGKLGSRTNVKDFMSKMVSSIPNHLPGLFGSSATESASGTGPDHEVNPTMKDGKLGSRKNVKDFISKMVTSIPNHLPGLFGSSAKESASVTGPDHEENPTIKDGKLGSRTNVKDFMSKMVTSIPIHLPGSFGSSATESASVSGPYHKENPTMKDCKSGSSFMEKLRNLKKSVVQMATTIPKYNPYFYGSSAAESVSRSDDAGNTQSSLLESSLGTHFVGLAIMVIMIVVFKRV